MNNNKTSINPLEGVRQPEKVIDAIRATTAGNRTARSYLCGVRNFYRITGTAENAVKFLTKVLEQYK